MFDIHSFKFFQQLTKLLSVEAIILFGSRARGDAKERSDIDLAIICPTASLQEWHLILEIIEYADTLLKIDCIRLDELEANNPLRIAIETEGQTVYRKTT